MTNRSASKFEDAIAEAAYMVALNGYAEATSGDVDGGGLYDLVTLDWNDVQAMDDALMNDGKQPSTVMGGSKVIIRTDSQGFVWTHYGPAHPAFDPPAYDALMRTWNEITAEVNADDEGWLD